MQECVAVAALGCAEAHEVFALERGNVEVREHVFFAIVADVVSGAVRADAVGVTPVRAATAEDGTSGYAVGMFVEYARCSNFK